MAPPSEPPAPPPAPADGALRDRLHRLCLRARPTQVGAALKVALRVRRRYVRTAAGVWLWVDPASQFGREVLRTGDYEPPMGALLDGLLRPGDVFVDAGANEGWFSVRAARRVGDGGRVVAVEPQTRLGGVLLRNLEANGCRNVTLRAVALDGEAGWVGLYLRPSTNTGASGMFRRRLDPSVETVMALPLDEVLEQEGVTRARVLKVDCEGAEERVVAGASRTLDGHRVDFVVMEYHPTVGPGAAERCLAVHRRLAGAGYVLSRLGERHVYHLPGLEADLAPLGDVQVGAEPAL